MDTITAPSWEEAVSVLELVVTKLDLLDPKHKQAVHQHLQVASGNNNLLFSTVIFCPCLQATIGQLERLAAADSYAGSRTRLYGLVESVSHVSPDTSVVRGGNCS